MRVRRDVAQPLEHGEREVRRRHLEREALADQAGELGLMLERVEARHDAAGAVTEQEHRQAGLPRLRERHERRHVADVVGERLDVEALAVGLAAAAQVEGVDGEPGGRELLGHPRVVAAVRVEAGDDDDHAAWVRCRTPERKKMLRPSPLSNRSSRMVVIHPSHSICCRRRLRVIGTVVADACGCAPALGAGPAPSL